jgi:hypothetical protein
MLAPAACTSSHLVGRISASTIRRRISCCCCCCQGGIWLVRPHSQAGQHRNARTPGAHLQPSYYCTCAGRLLFFYAATSRCMGLPSLSNGSWERYSGHKIAAVVFFLHKIGSRCKDSPTLSTVQVVKSSYKKSRGDSLLLKSPLAVWSTYSPTTRPWTGSRPVIHAL